MKIEVKNLYKNFKKIPVLKNVNITFEAGKIYGLIGRNGSGKSVFLKILCSFYEPTSGEVLYNGENIVAKKKIPPSTRALIENPNFLPDMSGYDNLYILAKIQNKIDKATINETLKKVNLLDAKDKKYKEYSLGMKQKLGIAQVLMENPEVIILDEPFNGIENSTVEDIRNILLKEKQKGKLIIIATHIKDDIDKLVDEIYEFDDGEVFKK